jgi:arylsulfatase A-like enzyme
MHNAYSAGPPRDIVPPTAAAPALTASQLLRFGVLLAIGMVIVEMIVRGSALYFRRTPFGADENIVWMAPAMNLVWFGGAAVLAIVGRRLLPRAVTPAVSLTLLTMPAFITAAWLIPKIHTEAALLLGIGVAVQAGRMLARRPRIVASLTNRAWLPVLIGTVVVIVAVMGWSRVRESRALAALPDAAPGTPNVLLLILDTVRSFSTSTYGYDRPTTPTLTSLTSTAIRFDRAFAPASWTMPSHATIFTGRWPFELRTGPRQPLGPEPPTLAEALASAGMATGAFAANYSYLTWEHGLDRGFTRFEGYPPNLAMFFTSTTIGRMLMEYNTFRKPLGFFDSPKRKTARMVNDQLLEWIDRLDDDRPFFAFLNYFDAHHPYLAPEPYLTRFGPHGAMRWRGGELEFDELSQAEIARKQNQYDGGIAYVDAELERLLAALQSRQELENTFIVITSDHGEHWGEHELLSHGNSMYRQVLQVPLLIVPPRGASSATRVRSSVSLRDLPVTILDAAGVPNTVGFPGTSLLPLARGDSAAPRSPVFSEDSPFGVRGTRSLIDDDLHYVRLLDKSEQLYDLEADSVEVHDLAGDPAYAEALARLRAQMDSIVGSSRPSDLGQR